MSFHPQDVIFYQISVNSSQSTAEQIILDPTMKIDDGLTKAASVSMDSCHFKRDLHKMQ